MGGVIIEISQLLRGRFWGSEGEK